MNPIRYMGIDGCRGGWFYAGLDEKNKWCFGIFPRISELTSYLDEAYMVLIDIPIGLRSTHKLERLCDKEARSVLVNRKSSIFAAPSALALNCSTYSDACTQNFTDTGRKISQQTWAICGKIKEVRDFFLKDVVNRNNIREYHPEIAFWALAGKKEMSFRKKTDQGQAERLSLLLRYNSSVKIEFDFVSKRYITKLLEFDDIIDAMAGAVTAKYHQNLLDFFSRKEKVQSGGGPKAIEKQAAMGKLTARERITTLLDQNSFHEYDLFVEHKCIDFDMNKKQLPADGVITGTGTIYDAPVGIFAQDFTVAGGSLGLAHARKITKIMDHSVKLGIPLIGINDSGGARIQEGVNSLAGYGEIFYRNTLASGVIPQISVILGPCAGGAVYSPALTDFVFVVDKISKMFITGPEVIKTVLGEEISMEELGGARVQTEISGNAHFYAESEQECFEQIKRLITFIPWNNNRKARAFPVKPPTGQFNVEHIVPVEPTKPYDVRDIIKSVCDASDFLEIQEKWASNIVIGFARLNGETVGIVANQPKVLAGVLDVDSSDKAARFIRFCDAFNVPLVTLVDLPGYLPGVDQEHAGVIRHGAKILYAYSEATVPKITVILRKAYGGGYIAMCSRHLGADFVFAWPTAEIAVMGPEGAANIIFRAEIAAAENPDEVRKLKVQEYTEKFANPYIAAANGHVDAVISPAETRDFLIHALKISENKKEVRAAKKHGVPPF